MLAAIVLVSVFAGTGNNTYKQVKQPDKQDSRTENAQGQSVESVHWGLFTARDTLAQWIAAIAALGSVGVSIWAVRLVRDSLLETRKILDFEKERSAVELASNLWIEPTKVIIEIKTLKIFMEAKIHNSGTTNAKDVYWRDYFVLVLDGPNNAPALSEYRKGVEVGIIPSQSYRHRMVSCEKEDISIRGNQPPQLTVNNVEFVVIFGVMSWVSSFHKVQPPLRFTIAGRKFKRTRKGLEATDLVVSYPNNQHQE
jgi:hypothetical protein